MNQFCSAVHNFMDTYLSCLWDSHLCYSSSEKCLYKPVGLPWVQKLGYTSLHVSKCNFFTLNILLQIFYCSTWIKYIEHELLSTDILHPDPWRSPKIALPLVMKSNMPKLWNAFFLLNGMTPWDLTDRQTSWEKSGGSIYSINIFYESYYSTRMLLSNHPIFTQLTNSQVLLTQTPKYILNLFPLFHLPLC